jgi:hypothetical protein
MSGGSLWTRFFYGENGACRSYLFGKLFLLMLAFDTWMLMIGHAGRYGMGGFNVAHFAWLDALMPAPNAATYVGVLLLTGLLALSLVFTGPAPVPVSLLFVLYTFSWSMSMLDSYQHHYFVSLVLFCMIFFPRTKAREIHPLPEVTKVAPGKADKGKANRKQQEKLEARARLELRGFVYSAAVAGAAIAYFVFGGSSEHTWLAFGAFALAIAVATALYTPEKRAPQRVSGAGFPLLAATCAILYTYTAIAKMDASWVQGHTLIAISSIDKVFSGVAEYAERFGAAREKVWSLMATLVIPQELSIAACYVLSVFQDRTDNRLVRVLCAVAFFAAIVLHVGAEAMGLQIGWFSYYMLALACCYFLPLAAVDRLSAVFTAPAGWLTRTLSDVEAGEAPGRAASLGIALGCAGLLVVVGTLIDLPGALAACALAAVALVAAALRAISRGRPADARHHALSLAVAGFGMWLAIASSEVRFDFYRYLGGDLNRRGELEAALDAYVHGERYAPAGQSRKKQIRELREKLNR